MKCEEVRGRLDALVDGDLPPDEVRRTREHIDGCGSCREEERRLRALLAEASGLPEEIPLPGDLWDSIALSIDPPHRAPAPSALPRRRRIELFATGRGWQGALAAAAVLVIVGGAAVLALLSVRSPGRSGIAPIPSTAVPAVEPSAGDGPPSILMPADLAFIDAKQQILAALDERKDVLSPETVRTIQENLRLIEGAVGEIHASLDKDPGNRALQKMLVSARRREVAVLRQVTQS